MNDVRRRIQKVQDIAANYVLAGSPRIERFDALALAQIIEHEMARPDVTRVAIYVDIADAAALAKGLRRLALTG